MRIFFLFDPVRKPIQYFNQIFMNCKNSCLFASRREPSFCSDFIPTLTYLYVSAICRRSKICSWGRLQKSACKITRLYSPRSLIIKCVVNVLLKARSFWHYITLKRERNLVIKPMSIELDIKLDSKMISIAISFTLICLRIKELLTDYLAFGCFHSISR